MENELDDNLKGKFGGTEFSVPENYFDQLNRDIQTRVAVERLKALTDTRGFTVPEHYFETLTPSILQRVHAAPAKKIARTVRLWQSDLFKYATAACFILMAAAGLYVNNQQTPVQQINANTVQEQILFDVDEDIIIDQLQQEHTLQSSTALSEQELENYILTNYSQSDIATNL